MTVCAETQDTFSQCGEISKTLSDGIVSTGFVSFLICCVVLLWILFWISRNKLIQKHRHKLLCIVIASMISSLTAITFTLDPIT